MSIIIPDPAVTDWVPLNYGASIQSNVPACSLYRTTAQSIANATPTAMAFDNERFDTDNIHDNVTNNSRLTCRTAGKYLITGFIPYGGNATGIRQCNIVLNGGGGIYLSLSGQTALTAADNCYLSTSAIADLIVGDYVELQAYQSSGGALATTATATLSPTFSMAYIGPGLLGRGQQNISVTYLTRPAANTVPPGTT